MDLCEDDEFPLNHPAQDRPMLVGRAAERHSHLPPSFCRAASGMRLLTTATSQTRQFASLVATIQGLYVD